MIVAVVWTNLHTIKTMLGQPWTEVLGRTRHLTVCHLQTITVDLLKTAHVIALCRPFTFHVLNHNSSTHLTLIACWFDVGPASATLTQHQANMGSKSRVGFLVSTNMVSVQDAVKVWWCFHASKISQTIIFDGSLKKRIEKIYRPFKIQIDMFVRDLGPQLC